MEERLINQVVGQLMIYDNETKHWLPAGTSSGLSTIRLIHCVSNNTFRIHGQKIDGAKEVVLDNVITTEDKFNRANESFVSWKDRHAYWGLNFRSRPRGGLDEADSFIDSIKQILYIFNQTSGQNQMMVQQPQVQPQIQPQYVHQQQAQSQQNQSQINHYQHNHQQQLQQQIHPQYLHQQPNQNHINHYPTNQQHLQQQTSHLQQIRQPQPPQSQLQQQAQLQTHHQQPQQQQQSQQAQQSQQQQQSQRPQQQPQQLQSQHHQQQPQQSQPAQVVTAPIPPPPPPPPPAPPIVGLNNRVNGTSNLAPVNTNTSNTSGNEVQHSPVTTNNTDRNGGSPNQQVSSLASELMKCQLKKVNLSRSDSEKESECNNNNIANPKTTRAASLAYVPTNLMDDLNKRLASRREKLDQKGDTQSNCSSNSITNGVSNDKGQETWLADLIRKEISVEMSKMKAEILDAIRSELRQR